jgi:L-asparaginase
MFLLEQEKQYDGFIILHGTDTMAYTSSALSFMLPSFTKPVILTGSMQPITVSGTDAADNIYTSFLFARALSEEKKKGVAISFGNQLIHGPRSQKILSRDYTAFSSINYPHLGYIEQGRVFLTHTPKPGSSPTLGKVCCRLSNYLRTRAYLWSSQHSVYMEVWILMYTK